MLFNKTIEKTTYAVFNFLTSYTKIARYTKALVMFRMCQFYILYFYDEFRVGDITGLIPTPEGRY